MQEEVAKETITTKTRKGVLKRKKPIVKKQSDVVPPKDIPKEVVLKSQDEASPKIESYSSKGHSRLRGDYNIRGRELLFVMFRLLDLQHRKSIKLQKFFRD